MFELDMMLAPLVGVDDIVPSVEMTEMIRTLKYSSSSGMESSFGLMTISYKQKINCYSQNPFPNI